jgi:hypothetical protein
VRTHSTHQNIHRPHDRPTDRLFRDAPSPIDAAIVTTRRVESSTLHADARDGVVGLERGLELERRPRADVLRTTRGDGRSANGARRRDANVEANASRVRDARRDARTRRVRRGVQIRERKERNDGWDEDEDGDGDGGDGDDGEGGNGDDDERARARERVRGEGVE